ncbi:hypothetical protein ACHAWU_009490 [Discostella pseudostelligera]|uniref:Uncharacterized protein n=1 Tax=Discostella pseudostelligera TaxID=259834 RepID=A0ABD3M0V9_9STRA
MISRDFLIFFFISAFAGQQSTLASAAASSSSSMSFVRCTRHHCVPTIHGQHHRSLLLLHGIDPWRRRSSISTTTATAFQTAQKLITHHRMTGGCTLHNKIHSPLFRSIEYQRCDYCRFSYTRLFNSMEGNNNMPSPPTEEEELQKWEKMYYAPMQQTSSGQFNSQSNTIESNSNDIRFTTTTAATTPTTTNLDSSRSEIRVITFDLDNTIWKTSETISYANDALASHLFHEFGIEERSEKRMGQLFRQYPERYAGVDYAVSRMTMTMESVDKLKDSDEEEDAANLVQNVGQSELVQATSKSESNEGGDGVHIQADFGFEKKTKMKPVYLTLLRKDAIRSLILANNDDNSTAALPSHSLMVDLEKQIDLAFDVWMKARCESISKNFVPCAVSTLQQLRSEAIYIGAITDGNSNPNQVSELSGLFDFVVRAEDVGVSKPDARVYKAAVASLMLRLEQDGRNIEEFFLGNDGDDIPALPATYVKSGSSSKILNWKDVDEDAVEAFSDGVGPWWVHVGDDFFKDVVAAKEFQMRTVWSRELIGVEIKQRSVSDLVNDIAKSEDGVLKMSIGPSEFLSQSIHTEFSDAILDRFGDLGDLLVRWQREGAISQLNDNTDESLVSDESTEIGAKTSRQQPKLEVPSSETTQADYKFCISCGGKLPIAAKFCSSCGEKQ